MIQQEMCNPFPNLNPPMEFWKQTGSIIQQKNEQNQDWYSICSKHAKADTDCVLCRIGQWHESKK